MENVIVGRLIPAGTGYKYHKQRREEFARMNQTNDSEQTVSADDLQKQLSAALEAADSSTVGNN